MNSTTEKKALPAVLQIHSQDELYRVGKIMAASMLFGDVNNDTQVARACVKIMAGAEYGFGPFTSMKIMHVIQGSPAPSYQMVATLIKRSGKYKFEIIKREDDHCILDWFEKIEGEWVKVGTSKFDKKDADRAGLSNKDNWKKYPRQMYFSRALTEGANAYATEIFGGPIYTPGELNVVVDELGNPVTDNAGEYVIDSEVVDEKKNKGRSKGSSSVAAAAVESNTSTVEVAEVKAEAPKSESVADSVATTSVNTSGATASATTPEPQEADPKSSSSRKQEKPAGEPPTSATATDVKRPGAKELGEILDAGLSTGRSEEAVEAFVLDFLTKLGVNCESEDSILATWTFENVAATINALLSAQPSA